MAHRALIDDDETIRAVLRRIAEMAGAIVTEASTGEEGLRALYSERPDVVVLDIGLPGLDGWQVLERIRQLTDLPVVMVSAHDDELEKVRALQAGADDYVTKPFGAQELLAACRCRSATPARGRRARARRCALPRRRPRGRLPPRRGDRARQAAPAHPARVPAARRPRPPPRPHAQRRAAPRPRLGRPRGRPAAREGLRRLPAGEARRRGPRPAPDRDRARLRLPLPAPGRRR